MADHPLVRLKARLEEELRGYGPLADQNDEEALRSVLLLDFLGDVKYALRGDWERLLERVQQGARRKRPLSPEVVDFIVGIARGEFSRPQNAPERSKAKVMRDLELAWEVADLEFKGMKLTPAEHEVAEKMGVSFSTVERAWTENGRLTKLVMSRARETDN